MKKLEFKFDKQTVKRIAENICYPLVAFGLVLAIWAIVAKIKDNPLALPMPDVVLERFFKLGGEEGFWRAVLSSILRTAISFVTSFGVAIVFASLGGTFKPFHRVLSPMVTILRAAPTVAVILIMYALVRTETMVIIVGFLIAFPIMYSAFYSAITGVDKDLVEMAKLYKVSPFNRIMYVYLPSIANTLFDTSRSTLSLTFKVVVAAEILTSVAKSLGGKIQTANAFPDVAYLLAWTMIAIVFSFVLEAIVAIAKKVWEVSR
ncbi:MAG: ABC transporter permease subunit [Clostridia bacterium]|nr:ABC transporter permease subunit [Clostridia bacterium]